MVQLVTESNAKESGTDVVVVSDCLSETESVTLNAESLWRDVESELLEEFGDDWQLMKKKQTKKGIVMRIRNV